jgi:hypothetical protein
MVLADVEVPWHQKHVDLAFLSKQEGIGPVAIELKVNSTSRAIGQAALNRYLTPSSWVATAATPSRPVLKSAFSEGVGVMLVAERGVYPLLYPRVGRAHTDALIEHLHRRNCRVRDILSWLRNG